MEKRRFKTHIYLSLRLLISLLFIISCNVNSSVEINDPSAPLVREYLSLVSSENLGCVSPDELFNFPYEAKVKFTYVGEDLRLEVIFITPGDSSFTERIVYGKESIMFYYDDTRKYEGENKCITKMIYNYKARAIDYLEISVNQKHFGETKYYTPLNAEIELRTNSFGGKYDYLQRVLF